MVFTETKFVRIKETKIKKGSHFRCFHGTRERKFAKMANSVCRIVR